MSGQMHTKENRVHVESTSTSVSEGPRSVGCKRVDVLSLINNCKKNCRHMHGSVFVVWKPLTQSVVCLVDRKKPNS